MFSVLPAPDSPVQRMDWSSRSEIESVSHAKSPKTLHTPSTCALIAASVQRGCHTLQTSEHCAYPRACTTRHSCRLHLRVRNTNCTSRGVQYLCNFATPKLPKLRAAGRGTSARGCRRRRRRPCTTLPRPRPVHGRRDGRYVLRCLTSSECEQQGPISVRPGVQKARICRADKHARYDVPRASPK